MGAPHWFGFRIVGDPAKRRRLVDPFAAFTAYAVCDERAEVEREAYLSAFSFGDDFRELLDATGSVRGFAGVCWSPFLWFDVDNESNGKQALRDTRRLASSILERYRTLDDDQLLIFFSGSKGFHVGLPTTWGPAPSMLFHRVARRFAERLADVAGATIDKSVYDKVRAFRAPNSKHPRTGLHKRRLSFDELLHLTPEAIRKLAVEPKPFDVLEVAAELAQAQQEWKACVLEVEQEAEAKSQCRKQAMAGAPQLNRLTLEFIRDGAAIGDRHRLLFSAAANLAEFGCPPALAHALLKESALDCGLPPAEVHRQIECGLKHVQLDTEKNGHG
jgi:hypothetical protein